MTGQITEQITEQTKQDPKAQRRAEQLAELKRNGFWKSVAKSFTDGFKGGWMKAPDK